MDNNFPLVTILMTVLSSIGACVSAYYAIVAGRLSKGGLAYQFFLRYSDDKMKLSLQKMGAFKREYKEQYGEEYINIWGNAYNRKEQWAIDLEDSRHTIKYYYRDLATLYQTGCIKLHIVEKICSAGGISLFMDCIIPMEKLANPQRREGEFYPIPEIVLKKKASNYTKKDAIKKSWNSILDAIKF